MTNPSTPYREEKFEHSYRQPYEVCYIKMKAEMETVPVTPVMPKIASQLPEAK